VSHSRVLALSIGNHVPQFVAAELLRFWAFAQEKSASVLASWLAYPSI
jgi:hypothetical protein